MQPWRPVLAEVETGHRSLPSMEPRRCSRGDSEHPEVAGRADLPSMEPRRCSRGDGRSPGWPDGLGWSFNGATALQPWRRSRPVSYQYSVVSFNGATALQPWRRRDLISPTVRIPRGTRAAPHGDRLRRRLDARRDRAGPLTPAQTRASGCEATPYHLAARMSVVL